MRGFTTAYRTDTGATETVPQTWVDNPAIFDGLYVSAVPEPPRPKTSRARRGPVETPAADAAHPIDAGDAGVTTTEE